MAGKKPDFPESPEGQLAFLRAVDAAVRAIPDGLGQGVFWWEPAAEGGLRGRSFFDNDGNVLPVITAIRLTGIDRDLAALHLAEQAGGTQ